MSKEDETSMRLTPDRFSDDESDDMDSLELDLPTLPKAHWHSLLSRLSCPDYTGKLAYKKSRNLFLRGAMCNFYRCELPELAGGGAGKIVVVKRRWLSDFHGINLPPCYEELMLWDTITGHENILPLLGYILEGPSACPSLIAEWTPTGTVMEYLAANPDADLFPLIHCIASGVAFMHSKGIVHGNIKQKNILMRADGTPLVSGFSLSTWRDLKFAVFDHANGAHAVDSAIYTGSDKQADVFAYGMTVMAMIQRLPDYSNSIAKMKWVNALYDIGHRDERNEPLWAVCQVCWHPEVKSQPTMAAIVEAFDNRDLRSLSVLAVTSRLRRTLLNFEQVDLSGKIIQLEDYNRSHGGFSDVYFGRSTVHDLHVAIKRVRYMLKDDFRFIRKMVKELQIWVKLKHKNVLPFLGFTTDGGLHYLSLITEWMVNGTIIQYIRANKESGMRVDILHMVEGIASGLAYLHVRKVVHSDMKSGNVLISSDGEPLLTDFGISHIVSASPSVSHSTGTYGSTRWMAYEQINMDDQLKSTPYTFSTDVWSFGMTVLELLTLEVPYAHLPMEPQVMIAIYKQTLPPRPSGYSSVWSDEFKLLWEVCEACWNFTSASRPSMEAILAALDEIHRRKGPLVTSGDNNTSPVDVGI